LFYENRIRAVREAQGLTLRDFAVLLNTSPWNASRFERKESRITGQSLVRLARILNVSVDELITARAE
jgi:transcriptional regulator with XRE-family HTH domain